MKADLRSEIEDNTVDDRRVPDPVREHRLRRAEERIRYLEASLERLRSHRDSIDRSLAVRLIRRIWVWEGRWFSPMTMRGSIYHRFLFALKALVPQKTNSLSIAASVNGTSRQNPGLWEGRALPAMRQVYTVCTIASKNYLAHVRVLAETLARHHPEMKLHVLMVDRPEGYLDSSLEPFETTWVDELNNIPNPEHLFFKYTVLELNTAVKPYYLEYLFKTKGMQKVIYCDPDIAFFGRLDEALNLLDRNAVVLTPHITQPYQDDAWPTELQINQAGIFNLGFIGLSSCRISCDFLNWWKARLYDLCYMDPNEGMHVDQKWINFVPALFEKVHILRSPYYNIAYWNLHQIGKGLVYDDGRLTHLGKPAVFFHFSGLDLENLDGISRHQNRFRLRDFPNLQKIFHGYRSKLGAHGHDEAQKWPYAFNFFDNGIRIPNLARRLYRELGSEALRIGNPFESKRKDGFFRYMTAPMDPVEGFRRDKVMTRLLWAVYRARPDLQQAFPDPVGKNRTAFFKWAGRHAVKEHELDPGLLGPIHKKTIWDRIRLMPQSLTPPVRSSKNRNRQKSSFGVNVFGYLKGEFGLGESTRAWVKSMQAANVPHALIKLTDACHRHTDDTFAKYSRSNPYLINFIAVNADNTHAFWRQRGHMSSAGKHNVAVWFWELAQFPRKWISSFRFYSEIWVASAFIQDSLSKVSPIPIVRMSHPVDIEQTEDRREDFGYRASDFIYLFYFDFLSVFERKNPLDLIKAFKLAFENRPKDAHLVIKTINSRYAPDKMELIRNVIKGFSIRIIDECFSRPRMALLMNSCDAFVSMHRSEGFGQGMAQAMLLGKPVIATGYSGNADFMSSDNSFPIRYELVELEENYGQYLKGNVWAQPDIHHAADCMKLIYRERTLSNKMGEKARAFALKEMSVEACASRMAQRFRDIADGLCV